MLEPPGEIEAQSALVVLAKRSLKDASRFVEDLILKIISKTRGRELQVGAGLLFIGAHLYYYRKFTYWSRRNVKNPRPLPFVGNLLSLVMFPYQSLSSEWLRKYGKVYGFYSGSNPQLVIADAKVVKQICIKDFDKFPNHNFFTVPNKYQRSFLIVQKDDHWRSMRAIISPTFTSGRMKIMYKILSQCADDLVELIHGQLRDEKNQDWTIINSRAAAGSLSMGSAVGSFYGIKLNDEGADNPLSKRNFSRRSHEALSPSFVRFFLLALVPTELLKLFGIPEFSPKKFDFFFDKAKSIVGRRLKSKERHNDYLQLLLEARADSDLEEFDVERHPDHYTLNNNEIDDQRASNTTADSKIKLTEWEIACQVVMLMLVATETTASLMSHVIFLLAHHKDIQQRLYGELAGIRRRDGDTGRMLFEYEDVATHQYLDCVISEVLRLMPPALRVDRRANQDYIIEAYGILVQKDMIVYIDLQGLHQNPEYWPEPDLFQPERFSAENKHKIVPGSYAPFGIGPRACIGFRFALTEAKVAIAKLVSEFEFEPAEGTVYPATPKGPFFIGGNYKDLRVSVRTR